MKSILVDIRQIAYHQKLDCHPQKAKEILSGVFNDLFKQNVWTNQKLNVHWKSEYNSFPNNYIWSSQNKPSS